MTAGDYPTQFKADVVLRTGHTLRVRPIRPEDRERLLAFYGRLSPETLHARFFDLCSSDRAIEYSPTVVDYDRDFGVRDDMQLGNFLEREGVQFTQSDSQQS